jgi:hypothetical protein
MPYISQSNRTKIEDVIRGTIDYDEILSPGHLNFAISKMLEVYWANVGHRYQTINDILGALEGAKLEFYRRVAVPYEEQKIKENGDIY